MGLRKMEYGSERKLGVDEARRFLDLVSLIAITAAPVLVLLLLFPPPLVPPILSIVSFVIACGVALYGLFTKAHRDAPGVAIWDIAGVFIFIWIVSGMMSNPKHLLDWFDSFSMAP